MAEGLVYGPMMALTIVGAAMTDRPHGTNDRHAVYKGQRSVLTRTEPHTRRDGTTTTLMVWRSHCPTCGEPFERAHPHESALTRGRTMSTPRPQSSSAIRLSSAVASGLSVIIVGNAGKRSGLLV